MRVSVRRDDTVVVIRGKDRGKRGKVLRVDRERGRVVVEGINIVHRHQKPTGNVMQSGVIDKPAPIPVGSVMVVCTHCKEPTRIGHLVTPEGKRVRKCIRCGEPLDA